MRGDTSTYSSSYRESSPARSAGSLSFAATASSTVSRAYAPADCVRISTNQYNQQEIRNSCNFDIEAHWQDTKGGWNSWSIPAGRSYIGGATAVRAYCAPVNLFA